MTAAKALAAALGALLTVVQVALTDSVIDVPEWGDIASTGVIGVLTAYAVWRAPNRKRPDVPRN